MAEGLAAQQLGQPPELPQRLIEEMKVFKTKNFFSES